MKSEAHFQLALGGIIATLLTLGYAGYLFTAANAADRQVDAQRSRAIEAELTSAREGLLKEFERRAVSDQLFDADEPAPLLDGCATYNSAVVFPVVGVIDGRGQLSLLCEYGMRKYQALLSAAAAAFGVSDLSWASRAVSSRGETQTALSEFSFTEGFVVRGDRLHLVLTALIAPEQNCPLRPGDEARFVFAAINLSDRLLPNVAAKLGVESIRVSEAVDEVSTNEASLALTARNGAATLRWSAARSYSHQLLRASPVFLGLTCLLLGGLFLTLRRVGQLHRKVQDQERRAQYDARHDAMTGLPNRAYFALLREKFISSASPERPLFVGMVDLDFFKSVNDSYGHDAGDALIKAVAERLSRALGPGSVVGRLGGDEFAFLVLAERHRMRELMAACYRTISAELRFGETTIRPSASIGIAGHAGGACESAGLMKAADLALYEAKAAGRGCYRVYRSGARPEARESPPRARAVAADRSAAAL